MISNVLPQFVSRLFPVCGLSAGNPRHVRRKLGGRSGFTLIETVMALGVVAFSMMGILGMLIVGLTGFREAVNCTVESQIVQNVSNDILLTNYTSLMTRQYPYSLYYDEQGNEVLAGSKERYFETQIDKEAVTAPNVDSTAATTFIIRMKSIKQMSPNLYTIIVSKG